MPRDSYHRASSHFHIDHGSEAGPHNGWSTAAGMTYAEIAEKTGYHRTTIAKWIANGGPPEQRAPAAGQILLTERQAQANRRVARGAGAAALHIAA